MVRPRILGINTGGLRGGDFLRMRRLTEGLEADITYYDVDKSKTKRESSQLLQDVVRAESWDLVYQEGTGIAGGINLIRAARQRRTRYIVSGGDPVSGFFKVTKGRIAGAVMGIYERQLYRCSQGFVGWSPYLTGRALLLGAPRSVTVEGAVRTDLFQPLPAAGRRAARERYGIPPDHLVCGVVGTLRWTTRQQYCYGLELVNTLLLLKRHDVTMLIVGDGNGIPIMKERIPPELQSRIVFTGRLPETEVVQAMNAMDIGFITQTLDELGSFRLTTKLPEYLACGLAVAMSPIPGYYDYVVPAGWALPASHPACGEFARDCAAWLDTLEPGDVSARAAYARAIALARFDYSITTPRFHEFVKSLL